MGLTAFIEKKFPLIKFLSRASPTGTSRGGEGGAAWPSTQHYWKEIVQVERKKEDTQCSHDKVFIKHTYLASVSPYSISFCPCPCDVVPFSIIKSLRPQSVT